MGSDRFVMEHRLVSQTHGTVAAEGKGTIVTYDYVTKNKASIPDEVRKLIIELESSSGNAVQPYECQ